MFEVTNITLIKNVDYSVWNVVFQMDHEKLKFTTDFLYLIKEKKWVVNSLITHELTSIMEGYSCTYCGESKIACLVASKNYQEIKERVIKSESFLTTVANDLLLPQEEISTSFIVVNDKAKWEEYANDNRFYGNVLRIQKRNQ